MNYISKLVIPLFVFVVIFYGFIKKVNLYEPTLDFYANCRYEIKCPDGEIVINCMPVSFTETVEIIFGAIE